MFILKDHIEQWSLNISFYTERPHRTVVVSLLYFFIILFCNLIILSTTMSAFNVSSLRFDPLSFDSTLNAHTNGTDTDCNIDNM